MVGRSLWWRKVGLLLATLVLTLFVMGPTLDSAFCRDEDSLRSITAAASQSKTVFVRAETPPNADALGVCFFGPCHHVTPYVPAAPAAVASLHYAAQVARFPMRDRVATSDPHFGLLRPPRA